MSRTSPGATGLSGRAGRGVSAAPRGFTLVEVLLALAIFAAVGVLLLSSFTGADRARELLSLRTREFRQLRLSLDRIGTDLQGAIADDRREETSLSCREDHFSGMPASALTFTAFTLPDPTSPRPGSDIVKVRYAARLGPDGTSLELYREQSDLPFIENRMTTREVRIADRLKGFRVEAWDGAAWAKEWPSSGKRKTALPARIAFTLTDDAGNAFRRVVSLRLAGQESVILISGKRPPEQR